NPSPARHMTPDFLRNIDYLIVNEIEALQIAQNLGVVGSDPAYLAEVIAKIGQLSCIITLEARGSVAAGGGAVYAVPTLPVEAVDATGAGDTFCGIFAACLLRG